MTAQFIRKWGNRDDRGQSLAEVALILPVLVLLIVGAVEVSNLLITQNRVTTAARVATGFGAANYVGADWDDSSIWAPNMSRVAFNNVTNTLDLSPQLWDIWTIHAQLNPEGTAFVSWNDVHAHDGDVVTLADWADMQSEIMDDVLDALDPSETGLEIVATVAFHDRRSILGLAPFDLGDFSTIRGLTVMRLDEPAPYTICNAFPIAISAENYAVYPSDSDVGPPFEKFPFDENSHEPYHAQQYYWTGKPSGVPFPVYTEDNQSQFRRNVPGVHLTNAPRNGGHIYLSKQSTESGGGGFGWLRWDQSAGGGGASNLGESLRYPGNAETYYYPPDFHEDGLGLYDLIDIETGATNSSTIRENMQFLTEGRTVKLPVYTPPIPSFRNGDWDGQNGGTILSGGSNHRYEAYGFALVKILGWYLPGQGDWLLFEFVEWDNNC
jgi:hypothetical protein